MGNCLNNPSPPKGLSHFADSPSNSEPDFNRKKSNKEIDKQMSASQKQDRERIKLLLLGAGASGKSTLFRQIENIHGDDKVIEARSPSVSKRPKFFVSQASIRRNIRFNCLAMMVKLLRKSGDLMEPPYSLQECRIDFDEPRTKDAVQLLVDIYQESSPDTEAKDRTKLSKLGEEMEYLWSLPGLKETFKHRHFFSLEENMDYFFDQITTIMDETEATHYSPTMDDILLCRTQTVGIIERKYKIDDVRVDLFDVGGQRNERRKWIQLFDMVKGVIFVAALNHYCTMIFEDERINGMDESLQLFEEIVNAKWFTSKHTQFILFLNKNDLFIERLRDDKIPLSFCFKDEWTGPNYGDQTFENEEDDAKWFRECYKEAVGFIQKQYLQKNHNPRVNLQNMTIHITTATEKSNIQKVFNDVRLGIIRQSLSTSGFHVAM